MQRPAHHKRTKSRPQAPHDDDCDHAVTNSAKTDLWEDAQVLQEDRELGEAEISVVQPDRRPEPHGNDLVLAPWELPYVLALEVEVD